MDRNRDRDVLRLLEVASPCTVSWDSMRGNDQVRFCGTCRLNVYNLSGMNQGRAAALVASREGRLCVRFFRRPDGTMVTRDCGAAGRRLARMIFTGICGFVALVLAGSAAGLETWMTDIRWPWRVTAKIIGPDSCRSPTMPGPEVVPRLPPPPPTRPLVQFLGRPALRPHLKELLGAPPPLPLPPGEKRRGRRD